MKRVSVALAAYNGERYIRQQIDSILQQLGDRDELVISDDGSTDRTIQIIRSYTSKDPRVRLLAGPGRGIKQNIAHALANTKGAYIFLADQDDVWMPDKVRRVLAVFREKKVPCSCSRLYCNRRGSGTNPISVFFRLPRFWCGRMEQYLEKQIYRLLYGAAQGALAVYPAGSG